MPSIKLKAEAEVHTTAVRLDLLLAGKPQGHGMRWARGFLDKQAEARNDDPCLTVLAEHLEDAKLAERLGKTPLAKYPSPAALMKDLTALSEFGECFPTTLKFDIMGWFLEQHSTVGQLKVFLEASCPWKCSNSADDEVWNPANPKLYLMEGSKEELSRYFRNKIVGLFTSLIRQGEEKASDTQRAVEMTLDFLDKNQIMDDSSDDEAEEDNDVFDKDVAAIVQVGKALNLLLVIGTPELAEAHLQAASDLAELVRARARKMKKGPESCLPMVAKAIDDDKGFYQEKLKVFSEHILPIKKHWPLIAGVVKTMGEATYDIAAGQVPACFEEGLRLLVPASVELPPGCLVKFEQKMLDIVGGLADKVVCIFKEGGLQGGVDKVLAFEKALTSLLKQASLALPSSASRWNTASDAMQVAKDTSMQVSLADSLQAILHTIKLRDGETILCKDLYDPLQSIVTQVQKSYELPAPQLENQRELIMVAARVCFDSCRDEDSYSLWHAMGVDLLGLVPQSEGISTLMYIGQAIEHTMAVTAARLKYKALGNSLEERIASVDFEPVMREWRSVSAKTVEIVRMIGSGMPYLYEHEHKQTIGDWEDVKAKVLEVMRDDLKGSGDMMSQHLKACSWPMSSASAPMPWKHFEAASDSFMNYADAGKLLGALDSLTNALETNDRMDSLFELTADPNEKKFHQDLILNTQAMLWTIKTMRKLLELDGDSHNVKLARFAKKQLLSLKTKESHLSSGVPATLYAKLEEVSTI